MMILQSIFLVPMLLQAAPGLTAGEQDQALERIREYSRSYADRLQDFTCVKSVERSVDPSGSGARWENLDVQEQEITYVAHKEAYKTLRVSGKRGPGAPTIHGEFSELPHIFDPRARTEFAFDHTEGPTCVIRYHATLESGVALRFRQGSSDRVLAHHGLIYADCAMGVVSRFQIETDPVKGKTESIEADIRYGPVTISGRQFMLPISAEDITREGKTVTKADVKFTKYKKYDADSAIHFDREN
jgi:hypothetical protein